jgi:wyosine [tRNA(Phe)-imidazoG37] synthetase (radical SAM superfamily)
MAKYDINCIFKSNFKVSLTTNGSLFTLDKLEYPTIKHSCDFVSFSLDAASKDVYENVVRLNGKWDKTISNIRNFDDWITTNASRKTFVLTMVVSNMNFREIPGFILLGKSFKHCSSMTFVIFEKPHHMSEIEYAKHAVHIKTHQNYNEYRDIVKSCLMTGDKQINATWLFNSVK